MQENRFRGAESMIFTRKKITIWIVEEDSPYGLFETIRICSSKKLAEHYKRILSPKWEEAFGYGLRVVEDNLYIDTTEDLQVETMVSEEMVI